MSRLPISYSAASLYESCPARFKAERVDKVKRLQPLHLATGIFLHKMTDEYLKVLIKNVDKDPLDSGLFFDNRWASDDIHSTIPEVLYQELRDLFVTIAGQLSMRDPSNVIDSELSLAVDEDWKRVEWDSPNAWLRARIDRLEILDGWGALVWDLKTGHQIDNPAESMQLKIYGAIVAAALPKVQGVTVELYYPRAGITRSYTLGPGDIDAGRRWISAISVDIERSREKNSWPAQPGRSCMDCPVFDSCQAREVHPRQLPPIDGQEAAELVKRLILVEAERKDLNERLRPWVEANGPVETGGMMVHFIPTRSFEYETEKLWKVLSLHVNDPIKFLKADTDELRKASRKNLPLATALEAIAVDKSRTTFKLTRAGA